MNRSPASFPPSKPMFPGGGEMAALIEACDWASSPLGPIEGWPAALRNALGLILPAANEIVLFWGPEFIAFYNDAYAPTIGDKHPRALGRPANEGWAEQWDDLRPLLAGVRDSGETFADKDRAFYIERHGYGEEVYFDISYSAVPDGDVGGVGGVGGVLCIVSETTERVRSACQNQSERERLTEMFEQAPGFIAVLREPGHIFEIANEAYYALVGNRDIIGQPVTQVFPEVVGQGFAAVLDEVAATGRPHTGRDVNIRFDHPNGTTDHYIDFVYQPLTDANGAVTSIFIEGSDVTDRWYAQQQLVLSEESFRLATESAELGTWDLDLRTDVLFWSERTKALFGISPNVPCSMEDFYAGLHPDDADAASDAFASAIDPARRAFYDVQYRTVGAEDGVIRWVAAKGRGLFDDNGVCIRAIGSVIDISGPKEAERALRESEQRFRMLADSAPALIWVSDAAGRIVFLNRWFDEVFGSYDDGDLGDAWRRIIHPDDDRDFYEDLHAAVKQRQEFRRDVRVFDREGRLRWLRCEGCPRYTDGEFSGFVGVDLDVTDVHLAAEALERGIAERTRELADANVELTTQIAERERVEDTLHQMQRLEAVGQLTSGVAHDFNNLLTVVLGNVGMIERTMREREADERTLRRIEHVRTAAERGAALTAQLLAFSRRQRLESKATDLNATVQGMRGLLESTLGSVITIETRLEDGLWPALVDPTQMELIILNLAINARDAMKDGTIPGGGRITIETANVEAGAPKRPEHPPEGDHVMVALSDTGTGMTDEVLAKAFEPFFTTKDVGHGSGLGLAQVFGFAKQSGGGVHIDTRPGAGTTVRVYLPRTGTAPADMPARPVSRAPAIVTDRRLLVVDDDAAVRAVTADALTEIGCVVSEAQDGEIALAMVEADDGFELAVIDFAMPGMNGAELANRLRALRPGLKILFVTGFADLDAIAAVSEHQIVQKPFDRVDLQARVGRLIEQ